MSLELDTQRRLTKAFINTMPVSLVLTPRTKQSTPAGGFKWQDGAAREAQTLRLIEPSSDPTPTVTLDGVVRVVNYELLGEYNALMDRYDTFSYAGKEWEIVEMFIDNGWEKRAMVSGRG